MFEFLFKYSPTTFERGEFLFASAWPLWLLIGLAGLAAVAIGLSLRRRRESLGLLQLAAIGSLQAAMIALALVVLWQPALLTQTLRDQDNAVALLLDTSASMGYGDSGGSESRLQRSITALEADALPALEAFDLRLYGFAGEAVALESFEQMPSPGQVTRIGDALLAVLGEARTAALGAVVLVSDGGDNARRLDTATLAEIAGFGVPVHTVGVGAEVMPEDLELEDVSIAPRGLPGSRINAQVSIRHSRGGPARLRVYDGDAILTSQALTLPNRAGVTTRWIDFDLGEAGLRDLRLTLDPLPGETSLVNNTQWRPIEVPETRRHVLYIEGEPRWEYKFIRRAVDERSPVRLASLLRTTPNKFYRQGVERQDELEQGFPSEEAVLFGYDALIIGSFEASALTPEQQIMVRDFVSRRGGSLLMLGGRRGLADGGWGNSVVADVLPARLPAVDAPSFLRWPAKAALTEEGARSLITRLDADSAANAASWQEMPELADYQHLDRLKPGAVTLLEARIQGRSEPLLVHQRYGLGNAYILATGGTWRWQMQLPHEDRRHETFWRQLLQSLATAAPSPVVLSTDRAFYADESEVRLRAEVRDARFEPAGGATVTATVARGPADSAQIEMSPVPGEPGVYEATYEAESPGVYRFEAQASIGEETLGTARVAVRHADGVAEHFGIQQNRSLLERIAETTGGRYFSLANLDQLPESIRFSQAGIVEREILPLWNMPFNFLMLFLLKAAEWLLRLKWGRL